jgi:ABC-2 type transport system ATP-binding protein
VLDAGTPAELVARHAAVATTRFGVDGVDAAEVAAALRAVRGVHDVELVATGASAQVAVRGERSSIAHVGAWLVGRGDIPSDLRVDVPDLEAALLTLLDQPSEPTPSSSVLTGARR